MREIGKNSSGYRHSALSFACVQSVCSVGQLSAALRGAEFAPIICGCKGHKRAEQVSVVYIVRFVFPA